MIVSDKSYRLKPNTLLDNKYVIRNVLGEGGFGITYDAENARLGMRVAIKEFFCRDYMSRDTRESDKMVLFDHEMVDIFNKTKKKFLKEAQILQGFSREPGVVHVIDFFESNNTAYLVMEYLDGINLREYVNRNERLNADVAFAKAVPILDVLRRVHKSGLVHGDITPENIMRLNDGTFCLIDFGEAYSFDKQTSTYTVSGKDSYIAPEQLVETPTVAPTSDIYAFCATLYFAITGVDPEYTLKRLLHDELKMPSELGIGIHPIWEGILKKGLKLKASERFQNTEEILEIISNHIDRDYYKSDNQKIELEQGKRNKNKEKRNKSTVLLTLGVCALAVILIYVLGIHRNIGTDSIEEKKDDVSSNPSAEINGNIQSLQTGLVYDAENLYGGDGEFFRIPAVGPGEKYSEVNALIWGDLYEGLLQGDHERNENLPGTLDYAWTQNGDIVSIVAEYKDRETGVNQFFVYNVSESSGKRISRKDVREKAGFDGEKASDIARKVVGTRYWSNLTPESSEFNDAEFRKKFNALLKMNLSEENLSRGGYHFDEEGRLCDVAYITPWDGGPENGFVFCLLDYEYVDWYNTIVE